MHAPRIFAGFLLLSLSSAAPAQPPYAISGLHTGMTLAAAVAQAEKLGGSCTVEAPRSGEDEKSVQCAFSTCNEPAQGGVCGETGASATGPMLSAYPISGIGFLAPADSAPLTRIVMVYQGDTDAVAASLIEIFGPTQTGGAPTGKQSWSHARRWNWSQGQHRMGLLDSPKLIILATDPALESTGGDS